MATPNGKGGWDLSEDDLAEMAAMGMIESTPDERPVSNINRVSGWTIAEEGGKWLWNQEYVTYPDHLAAVQEAEQRKDADFDALKEAAYQAGRDWGVQAARDIVWGAPCTCTRGTGEEHSPGCPTAFMLIAIDALKEKP